MPGSGRIRHAAKSRGAAKAVRNPGGEDLGRELSTAVVLFHEAVARRLGMNATEWKCLGLLDQHGPSTAGQLATWSGLTTGAITGIVDRLERGGYVRRTPHPRDRRSVIIHPVDHPRLKKQVIPIFASLGAAMGKLAGRYTPAQRAIITDYFERTIQILREQTASLKTRRA
jgi:DNA-binding MarR family transcriptional regulator